VVDMYHGVRAGFYLLGKILELVFAMLFGAEYYYVPRRYADVLPTLATAPRGRVSQLHVVDAKQARKATGWIKRLLSAKGILALAVLFSALSGVGLIGMTVEEMGNGFKAAHIFQIVFGGVMLAVSAVGGMKIAAMAHRASWVLALVVGAALPSEPESDGRSGGLRGLFGKAKQGGEEKAARTVLLFLPDKAYAQEIEALERQVSAVCAPEQRIVSQ